jgi:3-methyladenine DNA glycosylase/8-oxoguanine DNA glycosylase
MPHATMTQFLHTQSDLALALAQLVRADPRLVPVLEKAGEPALRRGEPGFPGIARIICGQQLSTASAGAIWGRLQAAFDPFHHDSLRRARANRWAGSDCLQPRSNPSRRSRMRSPKANSISTISDKATLTPPMPR